MLPIPAPRSADALASVEELVASEHEGEELARRAEEPEPCVSNAPTTSARAVAILPRSIADHVSATTKEANVQLMILETTPESVRAGYECPCGCLPSVAYARHAEAAYDACCCGNEFALGPSAEIRLADRGGFERLAQRLQAPWGEALEATWLIGPSTHPAGNAHDHAGAAHEHGHESGHEHARDPLPVRAPEPVGDMAIDPVCGMSVDRESARAKGLHAQYKGVDYFFCGRGCKLDFDEDPERYLDPAYAPSM